MHLKNIPLTNKVLAITGILLISLGFWSVSIRTGTSMMTFDGQSYAAGIYPYFALGNLIVIIGMGFIASALIYSAKSKN